jgi:uncharacterized membrane protein YoaK (UPF0700 family)
MNTLVSLRLLQISGMVGMLLPLVISLIKQDGLNRAVNSVISVAVCVASAVVTCLAASQLNPHNLLGSFIAIFIASAATYHQFFGPTNIDNLISSATSFLRGASNGTVVKTGPSQTAYSTGTPIDPTEPARGAP